MLAGVAGNNGEANATVATDTGLLNSTLAPVGADSILLAPTSEFYLNVSVMTFMVTLVLSRVGQMTSTWVLLMSPC